MCVCFLSFKLYFDTVFSRKKCLTSQWKAYIECSYLPNPKIEKVVAAYLSSWSQEPLDLEENPNLEILFKQFMNADLVWLLPYFL